MTSIKILGTGCPKCKTVEANVRKAVEELGIEADIEKVDDIVKIMQYNILSTPAVVVNEVVRIKGRVPDVKEIKTLFN
jgi:small redox-active disulfide protein 2